ncbi:hypothetical protein DPMN_145099 [Dreissena polymorpha]|uniref:Uncharacterized protein n=1 Tax=Dreissena polymorpha TaxID=45954 RepID=A0A9D4F7Z7_DREPO|nr:hypothetical protein DPMN_145099 [Dreissena polymorpha]
MFSLEDSIGQSCFIASEGAFHFVSRSDGSKIWIDAAVWFRHRSVNTGFTVNRFKDSKLNNKFYMTYGDKNLTVITINNGSM